VKGIYLTSLTLDDKFFSNVVRGNDNGWGHFILHVATKNEFPEDFPLRVPKALGSGLFFTDQPRWPVSH
jgi:hypothetical protein